MADASALVYVGIDPDTGTPSSLNAFGSGDVISEVIGGTGRTNLSGLFSSVGNVPVTYNTTTRQFVIQDVSGVSATVDFESVRSALAQASAAVGFNGQNLTNVTNLDVSGDLILSGYTDGKALFVSSNGLIIGRTLITGVARTATSPQPAPNAGSILRYSTTDSEYQAAADVRVGSGGALELYNGVGLEIVDGGYISMVGGGILAIGTGGSLAVTGTASVSSLAVSSNATVSGSLSAANYLNLPSSLVTWGSATSATNSYSSTNAYSSTLANSSTNAYSSTLSLSATDVVNAGPVDATYLTLTSNTKLTGERTFTAGTGLTGIDGGANSTYTLNADNTSPIWTAGVMFSKSLEGTSPVSNGDLIYYDSVGDNWSIIPSSTVAGAGGGAPTTAQYLTLATDATLTNERVLVANGGLSSNDGGAGGNFTVSANYASAIWNANKIQSTTVNSTAPSKSHNLQYVSTGEWKPNWNEVSTITATSVTLTTDIDHWFASAVNGPMNLTLPAANTCQGKQMSIIKVDTSGQVVTVSGGSITTILNRVKMRMPREQVELLSTGSEWLVLSHDRDYGGDTMDSDTNAVFDDFIQGSTETGEAGYAGWSFTNGSITPLAATTFSGSMGAFRRASGTTASQVASFYPLNAGNNTTVLTEHCLEFKLRGRASTTGTDHSVQLGLTSDLTTITPANGFYFERAAASGTWDAVTRRASAERRINTGITYQNTADPDTFRIFIKDLNNVQFYINDVLVANETNVSNTIPLAGIAVLPGFNITPTTTTARNFDVDYIAYTFDAIQERY